MTLSLKRARILIVDDFQGMRTMIRDIVKSMGVTEISTAGNARDALGQLRNAKFDIVICDYNLGPGQNGQQILEEARLSDYIGVSTIWVMVTAEKTSEMVMGAAEVKPDDYLLKPINQSLLESRLEKLILKKMSLNGIETAIKARDYASAIAQCDQRLKDQPLNSQDILRIKSDLLLTTGAYEAAQILFESVLAARSVPWAKTGLGKVLFYAKDYTAAKDVFQQVLAENKMYMEASDWLVKTLDALGHKEQAQQVLQDAVKLSPNSSTRQKTLADTAYKNGALDVAQAAFEKTIKISEFSSRKNPAMYAGLARVLSDKNSPEEALKVLDKSKKEFKDNPEAALHTAAAECAVYHALGQIDKAEAAMQDTQALMGQMPASVSNDLTFAVAESLFKLGKKDKACELLRDIVKNNHENPALSSQVEAMFENEHLGEEGRSLIMESRQEVININNQGVLLAKNGEFQEGVKLLRQALVNLPNNEQIIMNLCGLLIGLMSKEGKSDSMVSEVRKLLERAHDLNPSSKKQRDYALALNRIVGSP